MPRTSLWFLLCFLATCHARLGEETIAIVAANRIAVIGSTSLTDPPSIALRQLTISGSQWVEDATLPPIPGVVEVAGAFDQFCYRFTNGTVQCTRSEVSPSPSLLFRQLDGRGQVMCGLLQSQLPYCWGSKGAAPFAIPPLPPARIISAVKSFSSMTDDFCTLSINPVSVMCWGSSVSLTISVPSNTVQMVASRTDSNISWFGVTESGEIWSAINMPTVGTAQASLHWPLSFGVFRQVTDSAALRNDGTVFALSADRTPPNETRLGDQFDRIASLSGVTIGIRSTDARVLTSLNGGFRDTAVYSRAPLTVTVDSIAGDDASCSAKMTVASPCRTVAGALAVISAGPTRVLLSPTEHAVCSSIVDSASFVLAAICPSQSSTVTGPCSAVLHCGGCDACLTTSDSVDQLQLSALTFTGSTVVAVSHAASIRVNHVMFTNHSGQILAKRGHRMGDALLVSVSVINNTNTVSNTHIDSNSIRNSGMSSSHNGTNTTNNNSKGKYGRVAAVTAPFAVVHSSGTLRIVQSVFSDNDFSHNSQSLAAGLLFYDTAFANDPSNVTTPQINVELIDVTITRNIALNTSVLVSLNELPSLTVLHVIIANNSALAIVESLNRKIPIALNVQNLKVTGNIAPMRAGLRLYWPTVTSSATFIDCSFSYNTGSAMSVFATPVAAMRLTQCSFVGNSGATSGAAMALTTNEFELDFAKVTFENNTAQTSGGALALQTSHTQSASVVLRWDNVTFRGNVAEGGSGGGMFVSVTSLTFTAQHMVFEGNHATVNGGGLSVSTETLSSVNFLYAQFIHNAAGAHDFTNALPGPSRGLTHAKSPRLRADSSGPRGGGSAMTGRELSVALTHCSFQHNLAVDGAALSLNVAKFSLLSCDASNNEATNLGGAVGIFADLTMSTGNILNCEFWQNFAEQGGAVALSRGQVNWDSNACHDNVVVVRGGCLVLTDGAIGGVVHSNFTSNSVVGYEADSGVIGVYGDGGAIALMSSELTAVNCSFSNNSAVGDLGGSIAANAGSLLIDRCTFLYGTAAFGGAVGWVLQSTAVIRSSVMFSNVATMDGGALYASAFDVSRVEQVVLSNNTALRNGGAMAFGSAFFGHTATIYQCNITDNSALNGGGLFSAHDWMGGVLIAASDVSRNQAPNGGGGAFYWTGSPPSINADVTLAKNTANYGPDQATPICTLNLTSAPSISVPQYNGRDFPLAPMVVIDAFDCQHQRVTAGLGAFGVVTAAASSFGTDLQGVTSVPIVQGEAVFPGLSLRRAPTGLINISFTAPFLPSTPSTSLQLSVAACPGGTYTSITGECVLCDIGTYAPAGATVTSCLPCPPGFYAPIKRSEQCIPCPVGSFSFSNGSGSCADCGSNNGYTLFNGSQGCQPCVSGLECRAGRAVVAFGYWGWLTSNGEAVQPFRCLAGFCVGGPPTHGLCANHRDPTSPLCGRCVDGYVSFLSSSTCVRCEHSDAGMVTVVLLLTWLGVLGVMYLSSGRNEQTAELKVLFFFLSSARVILGAASTWTQWLSIFDNGGVITLNACVFALNPYNLSVLQILFPLVALVELAVTAGLVKTACALQLVDAKWYSPNRFVRTAMAIATFSFSSVSLGVFEFLQCIPAGDTSVVLLRPALDCHSPAYKSRLPLVYSVLVLWVLAVPIALVVLLYRLHKRNALRQPETLRRWGFLYATYGPRFFWFEGFVLLRRVLISGLAVLLIRDPQGRGAGLAVALIGFLIVQLSLSPYAHRTPNTFDVAALTSLLLITVIASGHSVLTDAEYPIVVQVSASLIVFTVALALLFGIFQGRWRRAPKMMALTTWLTAQRDACLHCICCDAQGSAGSAHYAADDSSLLDIYTLRSEDLDPSAPSSLTVPLSAFDNVNGANQLDQPTAYSEHTHSLASVSQGDAYEHPDQRANRMPLLSQPLLSDASP